MPTERTRDVCARPKSKRISLFYRQNNKNQLTTCSLGYDTADNMTSSGSATYTYDAENRLLTTAGVTYTYDGDGKRVKKSNGTLYWTGMGSDALAESDLAGTIQKEYIFFNGKRVARRDVPGTPSVKYYFSDHLGSASVITNATGAMPPLEESDYYPYGGEIVITNNDPNQYKFTGKERDAESGLDYFGARYYASTMGRLASADTYEIVVRKKQGQTANQQKQLLESFITNPQAWNKYAYGLNNPLKNVDVGGNCSAPAGLHSGQTGVCVEAFIAAPRIGGIGLGDNRTFNPNGGTYRFRVDVRVDPGATDGVSVNKDVGFSKVGTESINFGRRGTGDVTLGPVTTDDSGNRHFEVTGTAQNGFEAVNNLGTISFVLKFTATPDGTVTLDKAMGTTFPSIAAYT